MTSLVLVAAAPSLECEDDFFAEEQSGKFSLAEVCRTPHMSRRGRVRSERSLWKEGRESPAVRYVPG